MLRAETADQVAATSLPKKVDNSARVIGWK